MQGALLIYMVSSQFVIGVPSFGDSHPAGEHPAERRLQPNGGKKTDMSPMRANKEEVDTAGQE
jgi:hypothetical protein